MPLEVSLGEDLYYGNYENDQLSVGEMGDEEILVYNPNRIGRGFSVAWTPEAKKAVTLRLLQPTTTRELQDFYAAVERMAKHWEGSLEVEGQKESLEVFLASYQEMMEFNLKALKDFAGQVLDGTYDTLALYAAMWPMSMGQEEATLFLHNPHLFEEWLHEKQAMNVYHESPDFFMGDAGIVGRFILVDHLPVVLPDMPAVPMGLVDPNTGKRPESIRWVVTVGIQEEKEPLCDMEYSEFLRLLPAEKKSKYDGGSFLLAELTEEEIRALANR
jgi:hypothetical protein